MKRFLSVCILFSLTLFASAQGNVKTELPDTDAGVAKGISPISSQATSQSPWLSANGHARIKAVWPVAFPKNLKFYELPPRYQQLFTSNGGRDKFNVIQDIRDEERDPFLVSGGMAHVNSSLWHSVKGLDIPNGKKILAWQDNADVRAFALVPRWLWQFPVGTVAYDALFNAEWKAFEIRTQTRTDKDWQTKVIYRDPNAAPAGYQGLNQSCSSCHDHAYGQIVEVPGRIYQRVRWGSDGRFSWRPFDENGQIDHRWPVEVAQGSIATPTTSAYASEPLQEAFQPSRGRRFGRR